MDQPPSRLRLDSTRRFLVRCRCFETFGSIANMRAVKKQWTSLISLCLAAWTLRAADTNSTDQHATILGESVLRLLEVRDVDCFANEAAVSNQHNRRQVSDSAR